MVTGEPERGPVGRDPQRSPVPVPYPAPGQLEQGAPSLIPRSGSKAGEGSASLGLPSSTRGGQKKSLLSH